MGYPLLLSLFDDTPSEVGALLYLGASPREVPGMIDMALGIWSMAYDYDRPAG